MQDDNILFLSHPCFPGFPISSPDILLQQTAFHMLSTFHRWCMSCETTSSTQAMAQCQSLLRLLRKGEVCMCAFAPLYLLTWVGFWSSLGSFLTPNVCKEDRSICLVSQNSCSWADLQSPKQSSYLLCEAAGQSGSPRKSNPFMSFTSYPMCGAFCPSAVPSEGLTYCLPLALKS